MSRFQGEEFTAVTIDDTLFVRGTVTAPNPSYVAGFRKAIPQGISPSQLILNFGWHARSEQWTQQQVEIPVIYTLNDGVDDHKTVLLRDKEYDYEFELDIKNLDSDKKIESIASVAIKSATDEYIVVQKGISGPCQILLATEGFNSPPWRKVFGPKPWLDCKAFKSNNCKHS